MNGRSSTWQTKRPARFGRPLRSSNNGYGAWESPAGRAAPAHLDTLLRRHSCGEALLHREFVLGLGDRIAFVTLQAARHGVDLGDAATIVERAAELPVELALIVATDCYRRRQEARSVSS